jgi:short-subunit dehydrogenase
LWGVVHGSLAAYKVMVARRSGHIINTASLAGLVPAPTLAAYSLAKHGVVGLSASLRAEGAALGVKVSAVCPGLVRTGLYDTITLVNTERNTLVERIPVKPIDPRQAARASLRGVERNREIIVFPGSARAIWMLTRLSRGVGQWLAQQTIKEFRNIRTGPS